MSTAPPGVPIPFKNASKFPLSIDFLVSSGVKNLKPLKVSFISAIFMASVYLSTRSLMNTESSVAIIFYYSLTLFITSLFFFPKDFILPNFPQLMLLISLGIMGSFGHYFMSQAAKFADVVVISPFEYSSFIFVGVMGYYFYDEVPGIHIILGGLLIILSGIYIAYREHLINK